MANETMFELIAHVRGIASDTRNSEGICIFIGAGADISSGGTSFSELKIKCLKEYGYQLTKHTAVDIIDKYFNQKISQMSESRRCDILKFLIRISNAIEPSDGYKLLLLLGKLNIISALVTTNFDNVLERTEKIMNMNIFQIYSPGISSPEYDAIYNNNKPVYVKMHGDIDGKYVSHLTSEEISNKDYDNKFSALLENIITKNNIIFIGYSGFDNKITEIFKRNVNKLKYIYWCNIDKPNQDSELVKLLSNRKDFRYIKCEFENVIYEISYALMSEAILYDNNFSYVKKLFEIKAKHLYDRFLESYDFYEKKESNCLI